MMYYTGNALQYSLTTDINVLLLNLTNLQVIDGGRFLARPVPLPGEEDEHSAHLAALNNHYNKELLVSFNQVLKKGEVGGTF